MLLIALYAALIIVLRMRTAIQSLTVFPVRFQGEFNQALGLITLMFFGITVCAWASRRRLALATQLHEERVSRGKHAQAIQDYDATMQNCHALGFKSTFSLF